MNTHRAAPRVVAALGSCLLLAAFVPGACSTRDSGETSRDDIEPLRVGWLDELARELANDVGAPGVAVAWARPGETPQVGAAGLRSLDDGNPVRPGDRFHIGSLTKSMTATALAALVERGLIDWNDTLADLLPDIRMRDTYADVTLAALLRHRGGIVPHLQLDDAEFVRLNALPGSPTEQRAAYAEEVLALESLDRKYHYSNAGYAIAALAGERASGRSWEQLVRREVFEPLALSSCGFGWPATEARPDQPHGHFGERGARRVQRLDEYPLGAFIDAAGDIHCSVGDLVQYGLAHLAGLMGGDGFLAAATIQELHRPVDEVPYASGWGIDPASGQHRHRGSAGTFLAYLTIDPAAGVVVAFATNAGFDTQPASARAAQVIIERVGGTR